MQRQEHPMLCSKDSFRAGTQVPVSRTESGRPPAFFV
jgi:hypothetical protein